MKTTRTTKAILLALVCITMLGLLARPITRAKTRAQRINTTHNIVTAPIAAPASPTTRPTPGQ